MYWLSDIIMYLTHMSMGQIHTVGNLFANSNLWCSGPAKFGFNVLLLFPKL